MKYPKKAIHLYFALLSTLLINSTITGKTLRLVNLADKLVKVSIHFTNGERRLISLRPDEHENIESDDTFEPSTIKAYVPNQENKNLTVECYSKFRGDLQLTLSIQQDILRMIPGTIIDE